MISQDIAYFILPIDEYDEFYKNTDWELSSGYSLERVESSTRGSASFYNDEPRVSLYRYRTTSTWHLYDPYTMGSVNLSSNVLNRLARSFIQNSNVIVNGVSLVRIDLAIGISYSSSDYWLLDDGSISTWPRAAHGSITWSNGSWTPSFSSTTIDTLCGGLSAPPNTAYYSVVCHNAHVAYT